MWRKIGLIILIVVVVGVIAGVVYQQTRDGGGFSAKPKKEGEDKESNFEAARIGDLKLVVEATGRTEPVSDIQVKSEATAQITEFYVEEGDEVKKGDLICKLDQSNQELIVEASQIQLKQAKLAYEQAMSASTDTARSGLESQVTSAKATVENATESVTNAKANYERIEYLHGKGFATDAELDNSREAMLGAENQLASAKAALANAQTQLSAFEGESNDNSIEQARLTMESARVALRQAEKQLGKNIIYSPIDGIVLEKLKDIGDSVISINSSYGGGDTIIKVADLTKIQVRTSVDEIDIGKIRIGQTAEVTVDTYPDKVFDGQVTNIFPQGEISGTGLINFVVIVEIDNSEQLLLGNMTASVKIEAEVQKDVLLIPLAATRAGEKPDTTIVHVLKEGEDEFDPKAKTEERDVKLGDTDYYDIVVLEGLAEGDLVKVRGFETSIRFGGEH